ncbi:MAG: tetratricopeptide repeat protein [Chloroflexi bacterium]|nr:tetratricopeptide repeat protein [Chloroflexota bacterium]
MKTSVIMLWFVLLVSLILVYAGCQRSLSQEQLEKLNGSILSALEENHPDEAAYLVKKLAESPDKHLLQGRVYALKDNYEQAVKEFSFLSEKDGELYYKALCARGELEISRGNVNTAKELYSKAAALFPSLSDAHLGMAEVCLESGRPEAAMDKISIAEKASPGGEYIGVLKARTQLRIQDFEGAEKTLRGILEQYPNSIQSNLLLAGLLSDREKVDESQELLERSLALNPDEDAKKEILKLQAKNYARLGDEKNFKEVIGILSKLYPEPWFEHQAKGEVFFAKEKWQDAAREFEEAVKLAPGNLEMNLSLGQLYYMMRERESARKYYLKALEIEPYHEESIMRLADIATRERRFEEAAGYIKMAEKHGDEGLPLVLAKANLAIEKRDYAEAEKMYKKALELKPTSENAIWGIGGIALLRGDYKKAEDYFRRELKTDPTNFSVLIAMGETLNITGRQDEALKSLKKAEKEILKTLEGMPRNDEALAALSKILSSKGNYKEAEKTLKKVLELRKNFLGPQIGLASLMLDSGREKQGEELMKKLLEECPSEVEGRHILAEYYLRHGRYKDALSQAEASLKNLPGDHIAKSQAAEALKKLSGKRQ